VCVRARVRACKTTGVKGERDITKYKTGQMKVGHPIKDTLVCLTCM
jgi:hypothetical protein